MEAQQILRIFEVISSAVKNREVVSLTLREELARVITHTPSDLASILYSDLCKIQVACDTGVTPDLQLLSNLFDWRDSESVQLFHRAIIDRGDIVSMVADSAELSFDLRLERQNTKRTEFDQRVKTHLQESRWNATWSRFMYESRETNAAAYQLVRARLLQAQERATSLKEWEVVILTNSAALVKRELTFWYAVQISRCSLHEKAAVCHKLSLCDAGCEAIRRLRIQLQYDLFVAQHRGGNSEATVDSLQTLDNTQEGKDRASELEAQDPNATPTFFSPKAEREVAQALSSTKEKTACTVTTTDVQIKTRGRFVDIFFRFFRMRRRGAAKKSCARHLDRRPRSKATC